MRPFARRSFRVAGAVVALALLAAGLGCTKKTTAPDLNIVATDLIVGTGAAAQAGRVIQFNYTAWLQDTNQANGKGSQFATTTGSNAVTQTLGIGALGIEGLDDGIPGMLVGGTRRLVIPPALAFGTAGGYDSTGKQVVPPNAYVVYEITLVAVF